MAYGRLSYRGLGSHHCPGVYCPGAVAAQRTPEQSSLNFMIMSTTFHIRRITSVNPGLEFVRSMSLFELCRFSEFAHNQLIASGSASCMSRLQRARRPTYVPFNTTVTSETSRLPSNDISRLNLSSCSHGEDPGKPSGHSILSLCSLPACLFDF